MKKSLVIKILLIVFFLISIVSGLIIASFDPLERVKKEQDEKLQSNASEFIQASVQYYSTQGGLPWFSVEEKGSNCFENGTDIPTIPMTALKECVNLMTSETNLRRDFLSSTNPSLLIVTNPNPHTGNHLDTIICFQPQSKRWQKDTGTRYNQDGTDALANRCLSQGGSESCYWCTQ